MKARLSAASLSLAKNRPIRRRLTAFTLLVGGSMLVGLVTPYAQLNAAVRSANALSTAKGRDAKPDRPNGMRARTRALFGDLHMHTAYSLDAFTFKNIARPDDAYVFEMVAALPSGGLAEVSGSGPEVGKCITDAWGRQKLATNRANRPGMFTALIGYEWAATSKGCNLPRNVIFKGNDVPLPFTAKQRPC